MLSIDYDILRLFSVAVMWTPATVAMELKTRSAYARVRLEALQKRGCVYTTKRGLMKGYEITELGRQTLDEARHNPVLCNPRPWINRVRAGIDADGHELNLKGRAAIPAPEKPEMSYEMDLDRWIDDKRAGRYDEVVS